jgi:hypothetical protein
LSVLTMGGVQSAKDAERKQEQPSSPTKLPLLDLCVQLGSTAHI